ncbi:MAG: Na+/H+ antiporter NhaC [Fusobacteriaceae bacterium]
MKHKKISLGASSLPVLFLMGSLFYAVQIAKIDVHLPIFISGMVAAIVAKVAGEVAWKDLEEGVVETIKMSMSAILILLIIGMVIGTWILSGVVPTMIYYGLKLINPSAFLPLSLIVCSIVSLSLGSSWTTASTIGVALIGIGEGFGIDRNIIAGAIISGAYFGDKMSPLSDTTNLAPAMAGATLFDHIRHMIYTTLPAFIISLGIFTFMGMNGKAVTSNQETIDKILSVMSSNFVISPWLLMIPVLLIIVIIMKTPAIPGLFIGAAFGGVAAILVQGKNFAEVLGALHYGYEGNSGFEMVDKLLNRGGMNSMMWTVSLILCAMVFGGIMEKSGMLEVLANSVLKYATTTGKLIMTTVLTPIFINVVAGDQYLSIVIPGRMYKKEFEKRGLAPKNLSRCLEDSGTMTSSLIPWNTCGATMIGALGLQPWAYVPYCFLNLLCPLISILYGFLGFSIEKIKPEKTEVEEEIK